MEKSSFENHQLGIIPPTQGGLSKIIVEQDNQEDGSWYVRLVKASHHSNIRNHDNPIYSPSVNTKEDLQKALSRAWEFHKNSRPAPFLSRFVEYDNFQFPLRRLLESVTTSDNLQSTSLTEGQPTFKEPTQSLSPPKTASIPITQPPTPQRTTSRPTTPPPSPQKTTSRPIIPLQTTPRPNTRTTTPLPTTPKPTTRTTTPPPTTPRPTTRTTFHDV